MHFFNTFNSSLLLIGPPKDFVSPNKPAQPSAPAPDPTYNLQHQHNQPFSAIAPSLQCYATLRLAPAALFGEHPSYPQCPQHQPPISPSRGQSHQRRPRPPPGDKDTQPAQSNRLEHCLALPTAPVTGGRLGDGMLAEEGENNGHLGPVAVEGELESWGRGWARVGAGVGVGVVDRY